VLEFPRILAALGAAIAPVGLVIYGIGSAYREQSDSHVNLGLGLIIGGLVALLLGLSWLRAAGDQSRSK
jgi:septal ring-binding cell division protein DamX